MYYVYNRVNGDCGDEQIRLRSWCRRQVWRLHTWSDEVNGSWYGSCLSLSMATLDVLVSTTIIETGLDISNVNTMIIHDADKLGLSQLYQLRGRVGRSNRLAYAFLLYKRNTVLREVAEKRLAAIREFTELGSGFKIAMKDLEIRGAGNLLGAQQSGHMESVGYDLYCKMLNEAVVELKGGTPDRGNI